MTFNYSGLAAAALRLIDKFGRNVTLRSVTAGSYDTATMTKTGASDADKVVKMAIVEYKQSQIDGEVVQRGDELGLLAASAVTAKPVVNDIVIDSVQYKIINIETIKPGDTALLYKLQLRR